MSLQRSTVKAGETVTWKNDDTAIHTATSGKDATPDGKFDTSLVSPGQSSKPIAMPNEPGQYPYFCTLHPWMTWYDHYRLSRLPIILEYK